MLINLNKSENDAILELNSIYNSWSKNKKDTNLKKIVKFLQSLIPKNYEQSIKYTTILIKSEIPNDALINYFKILGIFRISKYNFKIKVAKKILYLFLNNGKINHENNNYLKKY